MQHEKPESKLTSIEGGLLVQDRDAYTFRTMLRLQYPTDRKPTDEEWEALEIRLESC